MTTKELQRAISDAARAAVLDLFRQHSNETFYYCSLITTGEGHSPILTAWSIEALKESVERTGSLQEELKWSYADSPYFGFGENYFDKVKDIFRARSQSNYDSTSDPLERQVRLDAMEQAMAELDSEGVFGSREARHRIVINAEVMPPDASNVKRAKRLNPSEALKDWLLEAAEFS